jgi:hypothetical protein
VTPKQLEAPVHEAAKGGKSDSETAQALRGKYQRADFEDLLADVREAALKSAEHDQLLKAIRQDYPRSLTNQAKVTAKKETNRAFLAEPVPGRLPVPSFGPAMISMNVLRNGL